MVCRRVGVNSSMLVWCCLPRHRNCPWEKPLTHPCSPPAKQQIREETPSRLRLVASRLGPGRACRCLPSRPEREELSQISVPEVSFVHWLYLLLRSMSAFIVWLTQ